MREGWRNDSNLKVRNRTDGGRWVSRTSIDAQAELYRKLNGAGNDSHVTQVLYGAGTPLTNSEGVPWNADRVVVNAHEEFGKALGQHFVEAMLANDTPWAGDFRIKVDSQHGIAPNHDWRKGGRIDSTRSRLAMRV